MTPKKAKRKSMTRSKKQRPLAQARQKEGKVALVQGSYGLRGSYGLNGSYGRVKFVRQGFRMPRSSPYRAELCTAPYRAELCAAPYRAELCAAPYRTELCAAPYRAELCAPSTGASCIKLELSLCVS